MQLVSGGFLCLFAAAAMTLFINQEFADAKAAEALQPGASAGVTTFAH